MLNISENLSFSEVYSNHTEDDDNDIDILVLFGPSNPYFDMIHYTALASLGLSTIISAYTLYFLVKTGKRSFSLWKMGWYISK